MSCIQHQAQSSSGYLRGLSQQVDKLRMLTVVSQAHKHKVVSYRTLKAELGIDNVRQLEDVIFDTMYSGLLQGKLDQRQEVLKVRHACIGGFYCCWCIADCSSKRVGSGIMDESLRGVQSKQRGGAGRR